MKIIKRILVGIGCLIALLLIVALFVKKEYTVEREITINKPRQEVFDYVKLLKNQDHYSKWVMTDPAMKKDFTGTDGTVGFVYAWDSKDKDAGKGAQEITSLAEGRSVETEVRFERPMEGIAHIHMNTEDAAANGTSVKWGMNGRSPYPLNLMNLFIPNILGKDLDVSLANLKGILEKP